MLELKIGHRGAGKEAPENTLLSFEEGIKEGANAIELDIRQTKDKQLVVFHDEKLNRLTGNPGTVGEYTLKELKKMHILGSTEAMPTLSEALDFLSGKAQTILLEIKEPGSEAKVIEEVRKRKLKEKVVIISFHEDAIEKVKKIDPQIRTGLIYASYKGKYKNPIEAAVSLHASYVLPLYHFTHRQNIEEAHRHGLKVIVWTVNDKEMAKEFSEKGVDGIASDYPEILKDL
ncbi:MAG: glycerophosphodiester phosphodiesterase [Candidatus Micrarchaeia archaeon]